MTIDKHPSDQEFLKLLHVALGELSAEKAPVTRAWVECLILETEGMNAIGEGLNAKRLAISLITALNALEHHYSRSTGEGF